MLGGASAETAAQYSVSSSFHHHHVRPDVRLHGYDYNLLHPGADSDQQQEGPGPGHALGDAGQTPAVQGGREVGWTHINTTWELGHKICFFTKIS